jgi:hypothetical protein
MMTRPASANMAGSRLAAGNDNSTISPALTGQPPISGLPDDLARCGRRRIRAQELVDGGGKQHLAACAEAIKLLTCFFQLPSSALPQPHVILPSQVDLAPLPPVSSAAR